MPGFAKDDERWFPQRETHFWEIHGDLMDIWWGWDGLNWLVVQAGAVPPTYKLVVKLNEVYKIHAP